MKFVLACWGSRGDVEPGIAIGRELQRRGHEVNMAVPPDLVSFVEAAGLTAVAYGVDAQAPMEAQRNFFTYLFRNFWRISELIRLWREVREIGFQCWELMGKTLMSLAGDGADLLLTGVVYEHQAANIAEFYGIPCATLHFFPARVNGHVLPILPSPLIRFRNDGVRVGGLASDEEARGLTAS